MRFAKAWIQYKEKKRAAEHAGNNALLWKNPSRSRKEAGFDKLINLSFYLLKWLCHSNPFRARLLPDNWTHQCRCLLSWGLSTKRCKEGPRLLGWGGDGAESDSWAREWASRFMRLLCLKRIPSDILIVLFVRHGYSVLHVSEEGAIV